MENKKLNELFDIEIVTWFLSLESDTREKIWQVSKAKNYTELIHYVKTNKI